MGEGGVEVEREAGLLTVLQRFVTVHRVPTYNGEIS